MSQLELPMPITGLPLDLPALAAEIHQSNIVAGWWKQDAETGRTLHRNTGELLALIHSEISEADDGFIQDLMDDKLPHRRMVEVELAETAIRVLDMLGFYHADVVWSVRDCPSEMLIPYPHWPDYCRLMHRMTTAALEGFRKGSVAKGCAHLVNLLLLIDAAAIQFQFDLTGAIAEKRAFNAQRADHKLENRAAVGGKAF